MKRFLSALLAVFMIATLICVPAFAEGEGAEATAITPDTSWYTENTSASEYHITTAAQFLGLGELAQSTTYFEGKVIYIDADIDLNPGWDATVTVNQNGTVTLPATPANVFKGIRLFRGSLDGQGHKVSGIYMYNENFALNVSPNWDMYGFIGKMDRAGQYVKNLALVNGLMYVTTEAGDNAGMGCLIGGYKTDNPNPSLTIENVYVGLNYVNKRLNTNAKTMVAGIIGRVYNSAANSINLNSVVYAGNIITLNPDGVNTQKVCQVSQMIACSNSSANVKLTNCAMLGTIYSGSKESYGEGASKMSAINLWEGEDWSTFGTQDDTADFVYSKVAGAVVPATVAAMLNHNAWAQTGTIKVTEGDVEKDVKALRILTGLESLDWAEVSYTVKVGEKTESTGAITTVYESVTAAGEDVAASTLNANYEYLYGLVIKNIPDNCTLTVTPVVTTAKGTVVTLHSFTVEVVNGEVAE